MKVIMPGKTVPYKCCLPNSNISVTKVFDTDVLFNIITHFQGLSIMFIEHGQNVNIRDISQIKLFQENVCGSCNLCG